MLPLVLFGGKSPASAFSGSRMLVAQHKRACVQSLLTWLTLVLVLLAIPAIVLNLGMDYILTYPSTHLTTLAAMLGILGVCWAALSFIVEAMNLAS